MRMILPALIIAVTVSFTFQYLFSQEKKQKQKDVPYSERHRYLFEDQLKVNSNKSEPFKSEGVSEIPFGEYDKIHFSESNTREFNDKIYNNDKIIPWFGFVSALAVIGIVFYFGYGISNKSDLIKQFLSKSNKHQSNSSSISMKIEQLKGIDELRRGGAISDEEFLKLKEDILNSSYHHKLSDSK